MHWQITESSRTCYLEKVTYSTTKHENLFVIEDGILLKQTATKMLHNQLREGGWGGERGGGG